MSKYHATPSKLACGWKVFKHHNKKLCLCRSTFQINYVCHNITFVNTEKEITQSVRPTEIKQQWESHLKVDVLPCSLFLFNFWLSHRYVVWSLQSNAKCLSPCLLRALLLGKASVDEYLKLSLTEIDCQGHVRCLHKVSPILFRWPHSRTRKKAHQTTEGWHADLRPAPTGSNHFSQVWSYNTLSDMINKSVDVHLFSTLCAVNKLKMLPVRDDKFTYRQALQHHRIAVVCESIELGPLVIKMHIVTKNMLTIVR